MCGICGIVGPAADRQTDRVRAMCAELVHRGPDGEGILPLAGATLGHRRLSIIDLSTGSQPIGNEDGRVQVVVNGEFYGFIPQREALEARGHQFRTKSDSEIAVHLYEERGPDFVEDLRGMFALALYDVDRGRLVLARDRFGKKPLYWCQRDGHLLFASELGGLLAHPSVAREPCMEAIDQYLGLGYVPPPLTGIAGVQKLGPGERLVLDRGSEPKIERYWELDFEPKSHVSVDDAQDELLELLYEAVGLRLISDVPLGAFLSGGLDSSLIVALMARQMSQPVKTFSIAFAGGDNIDARTARIVADRLGTAHTEFEVGPDSLGSIPQLVRNHGEPFADPSSIPTFEVSRLAREHVTVALTGDGGDELFAGYERYRWTRQLALVGRAGPHALSVLARGAGAVESRVPARAARIAKRVRRVSEEAGRPLDERYVRLVTQFGADYKRAAYTPEFASRFGTRASEEYLLGVMRGAPAELSDRVCATDQQTYLPHSVLTKVDIASMANALETRAPLLDHRLGEFAARLPTSMKLRGPHGKWLLRRVAEDLVPREVLHRPKRGFGIPMSTWMRGPLQPLVREVLGDGRLDARGIFTPAAIRSALDNYMSGAARDDNTFWVLLMLELWFRIVIEGEDLSGWQTAA
jgi:asparagine synthase (glutamine-hydrolysing)